MSKINAIFQSTLEILNSLIIYDICVLGENLAKYMGSNWIPHNRLV